MNKNYIYQTIHTLAHHAQFVAEHCRILERTFLDLYFRPLHLDAQQINGEIVELLKREFVSREVSVFVELRIDIDQNYELVISGISLYDGYAFRSIMPSAQCVCFDSPFGLFPTSVRREVISFAGDIARNLGGEIPLECSRDGVIYSAEGSTICAIERRTIIVSTTIECVERRLVINAAQNEGLQIEEREIRRNELPHFDEVFYCDHRGITAISKCGDYRYMSIIAEKLAMGMAQPW